MRGDEIGPMIGIIALVFAGAILTHGYCAPGFYVNGIRPDGRYECRQIPPETASEKTRPYRPPTELDRCESYRSRIRCTAGLQPIVVDFRTVGCQPSH